MPVTVVPSGGRGGFFDAASQSFNDFSKRAQEIMLAREEQAIEKERIRTAQQAAKLEANTAAQRLQFDQAQFQAKVAGNQATMEAMSPGLMQEFPNVNWQAALGADPETFRGLLDQLVTIRGQRTQEGMNAADIASRNRGQDIDLQIAQLQAQRAATSNAIEQGKLDLGLAQLQQENDRFNRSLYLDQVRTLGELAFQNGMTPDQIPSLNERFFGNKTGDPEAIFAQDQEAFKTEALEGETFNAFRQRKTADRAMGFFGISAEDRPLIQSIIDTGNPLTGMQRAQQAVVSGLLPQEALQNISAILSIVYPTQQRTFEGPGSAQGQQRPAQPKPQPQGGLVAPVGLPFPPGTIQTPRF